MSIAERAALLATLPDEDQSVIDALLIAALVGLFPNDPVNDVAGGLGQLVIAHGLELGGFGERPAHPTLIGGVEQVLIGELERDAGEAGKVRSDAPDTPVRPA